MDFQSLIDAQDAPAFWPEWASDRRAALKWADRFAAIVMELDRLKGHPGATPRALELLGELERISDAGENFDAATHTLTYAVHIQWEHADEVVLVSWSAGGELAWDVAVSKAQRTSKTRSSPGNWKDEWEQPGRTYGKGMRLSETELLERWPDIDDPYEYSFEPTGRTVGIIGCGKSKLDTGDERMPARQVYTGQLFRAALAHSEAHHDVTLIASARFGIIHPDALIFTYDHKLTAREASAWAHSAWLKLKPYVLNGDEVFVYAGETYAKPIVTAPIRNRWVRFHLPLEGLQVGERLRWFKQHRR